MQPNFYAIIPASVRYDKEIIPNAKLLYGEISAMCNVEGYCWAENSYFAELYSVSNSTISRWISQLEKRGHIKSKLNKKAGNTRQIILSVKLPKAIDEKRKTYSQKAQEVLTKSARPIDEKRKSIYENITINNTINREEFALDFFEHNFPSAYEQFCMEYKSKILDFNEFKILFNAKCEKEKLEFDQRVIRGRLIAFAVNYIRNQNESSKVIDLHQKETNQPAYMANRIK
jgi:DNA-binding MarR family transcriptional regulator